jgi:hypothetical protein
MLWGDSSETGPVDDGWTATTPSRRGLAIMWVALDDGALRQSYASVMGKSTCRIEQES